jgi:alkanesulfonate monooxygenase SsuD/methylene tetrahydromethanopterin reductase-like flavin-dependent oxidoreductase (luciferase family)
MPRYGISLAHGTIETKPEMARMADDAGFVAIWNSGESIPLFGSMATHTKRAKIGTGTLLTFQHDARNLVQYSDDLQRLSGGRFIYGLGTGTKRRNLNVIGKSWDNRLSRLAETIETIKAAWRTPKDNRFVYEGEYVQLKGQGLGDPAVQRPPIYVGALNTRALRYTAEHCEGLCGHPIASVPFIENHVWPNLEFGFKRAGRTRDGFDHATWVITAISNDRKQALRELKWEAGHFMATRSFAIVLDSQGLESVRLAIQDAFFSDPNDPERLIAAVPDEVAASHGIYGTQDEVREQVKRYESVVDTPTFYSASNPMTQDRIQENLRLMIETFGTA